jgi:WD40 repeat protein
MSISIDIINVILTNYYINHLTTIKPSNKTLLEKIQYVKHNTSYTIVTCSREAITSWNLNSWLVKKIYKSNTDILDVISIDPSTCLLSTKEGKLIIINVDSHNVEKVIKTTKSYICSVLYLGGSQIAFADGNSEIIVYDFHTETVIKEFTGHYGVVNCIIKIDEETLASGDNDNDIIIWHVNDSDSIVLSRHTKPITCLLYLGNDIMASGSWDGTIKLWDVRKGSLIQTSYHDTNVSSLLRYNNDLFLSAGGCKIIIWNVLDFSLVSGIKRVSRIRNMLLLNDNNVLASSDNRDLEIINLGTGLVEKTISLWFNCTNLLKYTHDEIIINYPYKELVKLSLNSDIKILRASAELDLYNMSPMIQYDTNHLIFSSNCDLVIYNVKRNIITKRLKGHDNYITSLLKFDKNIVISGSYEVINIWDIEKEDIIHEVSTGYDDISCLAKFNKQYLISGGEKGKLLVWDMNEYVLSKRLEGHEGKIDTIIQLDKEKIITGGVDMSIKVWNVVTGQLIRNYNSLIVKEIDSLIFLGSDRIAFNDQSVIKVFNICDGQFEKELIGHSGKVVCLSKINRKLLLSFCNDMTVKVWDMDSSKCIDTQSGYTCEIKACLVLYS